MPQTYLIYTLNLILKFVGFNCSHINLSNGVVRYVDLGILDERVVNCIRLAKECLQQNSGSNRNTSQLAVETVFTGERGRPRLQIPLEQLVFLLRKKFKVDEIAKLFITSKRTVERHMREFGLSAGNFYTSLSDEQLDAVINDIQRDFPNVGCKRITGLLRARGIQMQQARIRQSMHRVDSDRVLLQAHEMNITQGRHFSVADPLSQQLNCSSIIFLHIKQINSFILCKILPPEHLLHNKSS